VLFFVISFFNLWTSELWNNMTYSRSQMAMYNGQNSIDISVSCLYVGYRSSLYCTELNSMYKGDILLRITKIFYDSSILFHHLIWLVMWLLTKGTSCPTQLIILETEYAVWKDFSICKEYRYFSRQAKWTWPRWNSRRGKNNYDKYLQLQ
jgi:hypothetical protein